MAQILKSPRLYLRRRDGSAYWVIRYRSHMIATGCSETERSKAQQILDAYSAEIGDVGEANHAAADLLGEVYFATCKVPDFPIKIGWTTDAKARLTTLQVGLPHRLVFLATKPGTLGDERDLHIAFHDTRLVGEWFQRSPGLMSVIHLNRTRGQWV